MKKTGGEKMYETEQEIEKVILVAVCSNPNQDPEESLDELEEIGRAHV